MTRCCKRERQKGRIQRLSGLVGGSEARENTVCVCVCVCVLMGEGNAVIRVHQSVPVEFHFMNI